MTNNLAGDVFSMWRLSAYGRYAVRWAIDCGKDVRTARLYRNRYALLAARYRKRYAGGGYSTSTFCMTHHFLQKHTAYATTVRAMGS